MLLGACAAFASSTVSAQTILADGGVKLGSQSYRCGSVRTVLDRTLPMEGAAVIGDGLYLNPGLMQRHPEAVRIFIYHHECAHHRGEETELGADCWAVDRGVQGGWLDRTGLAAVCRSFANEPESDTHPSGQRRCRNLDRCFARASQAYPATIAAAASRTPPLPVRGFRLRQGPTFISEGVETPAMSADDLTRSGPDLLAQLKAELTKPKGSP